MAGSIIKQADPALKFCLDLIKFPPVLPATDTRLSLRVAQSIESLTGSAQPTKEQFIRAVESLPPKYAFTKKRLLRNLMNDSQAPLTDVQLGDMLRDIMFLGNKSKLHNYPNQSVLFPISIHLPRPTPMRKNLESAVSTPAMAPLSGEDFSRAWNHAGMDTRILFLEQRNLIDTPTPHIIQRYSERSIFESVSIKPDFIISVQTLRETFQINPVYNEYLLRTYIYKEVLSHKLKKIYSDYAAREWTKLKPKEHLFLEQAYNIDPSASTWEKRKIYINLVVDKMQKIHPQTRDELIKYQSIDPKPIALYPKKLREEAAAIIERDGFIPTVIKIDVSPSEILKWKQVSIPRGFFPNDGINKPGYGKRYTDEDKAEILDSIASGESTGINICRELGISTTTLTRWKHERAAGFSIEKKIEGVALAKELGSYEDAAKQLGYEPLFIKLWEEELSAK